MRGVRQCEVQLPAHSAVAIPDDHLAFAGHGDVLASSLTEFDHDTHGSRNADLQLARQ
jgi:hypothetical protein